MEAPVETRFPYLWIWLDSNLLNQRLEGTRGLSEILRVRFAYYCSVSIRHLTSFNIFFTVITNRVTRYEWNSLKGRSVTRIPWFKGSCKRRVTMTPPMERIQILETIEKDIIVCLQSAGNCYYDPLGINSFLKYKLCLHNEYVERG